MSTKKHGEHAISHLKIEEIKEIPSCQEEYTCDAHRTRSLGDYTNTRKHIAVDASDHRFEGLRTVWIHTRGYTGFTQCQHPQHPQFETYAILVIYPYVWLISEVYTYNIGSYEGGMRDDNVPCVPSNIDVPRKGLALFYSIGNFLNLNMSRLFCFY